MPLSQNRQRFFCGIKIVQIERCDFTGPGAGIIKQMEECIIPEALFSSQINGLKHLKDFVLVKKPDKRFLASFLGDIGDVRWIKQSF